MLRRAFASGDSSFDESPRAESSIKRIWPREMATAFELPFSSRLPPLSVRFAQNSRPRYGPRKTVNSAFKYSVSGVGLSALGLVFVKALSGPVRPGVYVIWT